MKLFITEEEKKQILKKYEIIISENIIESKNPIEEMKKIQSNIDKLLSYYTKSEDGKFIDSVSKSEVNLVPMAGFYKAQIESVLFGAMNEKRPEEEIKQLNLIKNEIKSGKMGDFFGDYDQIQIPKQKFDYYTQMNCSKMNPKSPGCV